MSKRGRKMWVIASAIAITSGFLGCGESDDVSSAVSKAGDDLSTLSPSGSTPAPDGMRRETYTRVAQELSGAARSGEGDIRGVAYMLASQAESGSAQVAHHTLRPLASVLTDTSMLIQSELGSHELYVARAESIASYDASEDRAEVGQRIESLEAERASIRRERDVVASRIESLREEASAFNAEAQSLRTRAAEMRLEAENMDHGSERVVLVEEAVAVGREADAEARQAEERRAEARNLVPLLDRQERELARVNKQIASAQSTLERIDQAVNDRRERAREARAEAEDAASTVRQRAESLVELINGEFAETYAKMGGAFDSALSSVSQASRAGSREDARASRGVIEHAAYIAHREASESLAVALMALENASEAGVSVEWIDEVRSMHEEARSRAEELREAAMNSLGSSGVRGEAGDRMARLAERLAPEEDSGESSGQ